jgi:ribosomal protein L37E
LEDIGFCFGFYFRMPFKSAEAPQCPRCGHAAFHAESIPAAGKMWHKICFRCGKNI